MVRSRNDPNVALIHFALLATKLRRQSRLISRKRHTKNSTGIANGCMRVARNAAICKMGTRGFYPVAKNNHRESWSSAVWSTAG